MKKISFPYVLVLTIIMLLTFSACSKDGGNGGGGGGGSTPTITINANMTYSPATLTVKQNTVINIVNADAVTHSATSDNGTTFDIEVPGGNTRTYNTPTIGTFPYHCRFHAGMAGTLVVTP